MKNFYLLLLLALLSIPALAQQQTLDGYIEAAREAEARHDYVAAFGRYKVASEFDNAKGYNEQIDMIRYKAGLNAFHATAYRSAQAYMTATVNSPTADSYPLARYYLAEAMFRQGEYDAAVAVYQQFLDQEPAVSEVFAARARRQIEDADEALERLSRPDEVVLTRMPNGINTENGEVSYVKGPKGKFYYASNDHIMRLRDTFNLSGNQFRIMVRNGEDSGELADKVINIPNKQVANPTFNTAMDRVYFSVCEYVALDQTRCDVYQSTVSADGKFGPPTMLPLNQAGASTTQPSVGKDLSTGQEYLFFASNRSGGKGKLDLYRATIDTMGQLGAPVNLADLNTADDDGTPFWYAPTQTLYFSTDGRFSFGGLDLYQANWTGTGFGEPRNLGHPANSSADDAYLTRFEDDENAYIASRRIGPEVLVYSGQEDICCYELYQYPVPPIELIVTTFHDLTKEALGSCTVKLHEITPEGDTLMLAEKTNGTSNEFRFEIEDDRKYFLTGDRDRFIGDTDMFDLNDAEFDGVNPVERQLYLTPGFELDVFTFNSIDDSELSGASVELYEMADNGDLTLLESKSNPLGHDYHWMLPLGKRYLAKGFTSDRIGTDTGIADARSISENENTKQIINLYLGQLLDVYVIDAVTREPLDQATLALTRSTNGSTVREKLHEGNHFQYIVNLDQPFISDAGSEGYFPRVDTLTFTQQDLEAGGGKLVFEIPLIRTEAPVAKVYFDNDYPNPRTTRTTTSPATLTYETTFDRYRDRRQDFLDGATAKMDTEKAFTTRGDVNQFFTEKVEIGFLNLERMAEWLLYVLPGGQNVTLQLSGSASPRAATGYNRNLSMRRIDSVTNWFEQYRDGELKQYITGRNPQLTFLPDPLGESSPDARKPDISDDIDRPELSIYAPNASEARNVEVRIITPTKK